MKKTSLVLLASVCLLFLSCKKLVKVVMPQVNLSSVVYYGLDTVIAKGNIVSNGNGEITMEGFICSTNPDFSGYPPQIVTSGLPGFSKLIPATHYETYYFKAFATNSAGTAYSNVIKYTVPPPPPATAPCTLTTNVINDGGASFSVSPYLTNNGSWGNYQVNLSGSNEDVNLYFFDIPHNGIYTTVADPSNISAGQIAIGITNFYNYYTDGGQKVYIALDTTAKKTIITFCSLSYNLNGLGTAHISGNATY